MSFGGAECSTGRNPLAQLAKIHDDKPMQRDRLVGLPIAPDGNLRSIPTMSAMDQKLMDEYLNQQSANDAFAFGDLRHHLEDIHHLPAAPSGPMNANWAAEFAAMPAHEQARIDPAFRPGPQFDAAEFAQFQHQAQLQETRLVTPTAVAGVQKQFYRPQQFQGYQHFGRFHAHSPLHVHKPPVQQQQQHQHQQQPQGKGKERMTELDDANWAAQFAELEKAEQAEDEAAAKSIDAELQQQDEAGMFGDFHEVWGSIEKEQLANGLTDINLEWVSQFDSQQTWSSDLSSTKSMPNSGEYMFEPDNPYMTLDDPFLEGKRLMETGGNLSLAALAFEAAVQQKSDHIEAWTMLGSCQAQNEKETPAIRALETALRLDPKNLNAMMGLAVSYTNEGYDTTAYAILERWISTKYPELTKDSPPTTTVDRQALHQRVTDLFIRAAQLSPEGQGMDSDVQVGLGVLFYGDEEYDKAVDCFNAALIHDYDARDKNHLLWNRLGATLANSGRSEEAINAYERALTINPNFVRARYNLGVSCINIGCYEQAAQHLLGALAMHKVAEDKARNDAKSMGMDPDRITHNQSTNLYDTLRRVFSQMGRRDLADMVMSGMDVDVFRGEFEF
ncbi:hypothetical protein BDZ91DRAFT_775169 [Kalaharituber pfeilii]|nr:hypothetical protein BDZ91DRAFT_775169 [Kalaharituber pfeilii]